MCELINGGDLLVGALQKFYATFKDVLREYRSAVVVDITNVGSKQLQTTRKMLRGIGRMVIGKSVADARAESQRGGDHLRVVLLLCAGKNVRFAPLRCFRQHSLNEL